MLIATWLSVKGTIEANEAKELAHARLADADAVPDFLFEAFRQASPQNGGANMLALDVLRQAETSVTSEFSSQPVIRARIQEAIATTYRDLGRADLASTVLTEALRSAREVPENKEMVQRLSFLLNGANRASGSAEEALLISRKSWRNLSESLGENDKSVHNSRLNHCRNLLEAAYWNDDRRTEYLNEVEETLREVLDNPGRFPGFNERAYRAVMAQHATGSGNHEAAFEFWNEEIDRHHLEGRVRQKGHYWPSSFLVAALRRTDRLEEATAAAESLSLHCHDFYGPYHPNTTDSARYLASVFEDRGKPIVAAMICQLTALSRGSIDPIFEKNVAELVRWSGELQISSEDKEILSKTMDLLSSGDIAGSEIPIAKLDPGAAFWCGEHLWNSQNRDLSLTLIEQAYEESINQFGAKHPIALTRGNRYALHCIEIGKLATASKILTPQIFDEEVSWRNGPILDIALDLAEALQSKDDHESAQQITNRIIAIHLEKQGIDEERMRRCSNILTAEAMKQHDHKQLAEIYEGLWHSFTQIFGDYHSFTLYNRIRHVDCLIASQQCEEALTKIEDVLRSKAPRNLQFASWRVSKARAMIELGQFSEAESILLADWNQFQDQKSTDGKPPPQTKRIRYRLSDSLRLLYEKWSKPDEMAEWKVISTSLIPSTN